MTRKTARQTDSSAAPVCQAFHPAYTLYEVPSDPPRSSPRHPRGVHSTQPVTMSYALLRDKPFYVLKSSLNDPERDNIVIGKATMTGSNWAAYAITSMDVDDVVGFYSVHKVKPKDLILPSEDPRNVDYAVSITHHNTKHVYKVNAYYAAACHARFIDGALTEAEENCRFAIKNHSIVVLATKYIEPGAQLLIRYGHDYWLQRADHLPISLLTVFFNKYITTMIEGECKEWRRVLLEKQTSNKRKHELNSEEVVLLYCIY